MCLRAMSAKVITVSNLSRGSASGTVRACGKANCDNNYAAAKQDFATRSGLIPSSLLFTREQLAVIFDAAQNMTTLDLVSNPEQEKLLEGIMKQIEEAVPQVIDLENELPQSDLPLPIRAAGGRGKSTSPESGWVNARSRSTSSTRRQREYVPVCWARHRKNWPTRSW